MIRPKADLHHQRHRGAQRKIRRAVRTRGHVPSDEAAAKLIYLALNATSQEWKRSVREWHAVKSQCAIMFKNRFPMA